MVNGLASTEAEIGTDARLTAAMADGSMPLSFRRVDMKRDMDLIRKILQHVEARPDLRPQPVRIEGVDEIILGRHVEMLFDLGYIEGSAIATYSKPYKQVLATDLSFDGHEFCAAISRKGVLEAFKAAFDTEDMASLPLKAIKEGAVALSVAYVKSKIGMV